ncbi:MAG: hypothetical protein AAF799_22690 [Myxococcota bacterium]
MPASGDTPWAPPRDRSTVWLSAIVLAASTLACDLDALKPSTDEKKEAVAKAADEPETAATDEASANEASSVDEPKLVPKPAAKTKVTHAVEPDGPDPRRSGGAPKAPLLEPDPEPATVVDEDPVADPRSGTVISEGPVEFPKIPGPLVPSLTPPPALSYLIWRQLPSDETPRYETVWKRKTEHGQEYLGTRGGLILASGEQIYTWETRDVSFENVACEAYPSEGPVGEDDWVSLTETAARLVPHGKGLVLKLNDPHGGRQPDVYPLMEFERSFVVTGNLGPYLFVRSLVHSFECDSAHPSFEGQPIIFDISSGRVQDMVPEPSAERLEGLLPAITSRMKAEDLEDDAPSSAKGIKATELVPDYRPSGPSMDLEIVLTVETCYACSESEAGAGTWSTRIPYETPLALRQYQVVPQIVADHFADQAKGSIVGFTAVETEAAEGKLSEIFASRAPKIPLVPERRQGRLRPRSLPEPVPPN